MKKQPLDKQAIAHAIIKHMISVPCKNGHFNKELLVLICDAHKVSERTAARILNQLAAEKKLIKDKDAKSKKVVWFLGQINNEGCQIEQVDKNEEPEFNPEWDKKKLTKHIKDRVKNDDQRAEYLTFLALQTDVEMGEDPKEYRACISEMVDMGVIDCKTEADWQHLNDFINKTIKMGSERLRKQKLMGTMKKLVDHITHITSPTKSYDGWANVPALRDYAKLTLSISDRDFYEIWNSHEFKSLIFRARDDAGRTCVTVRTNKHRSKKPWSVTQHNEHHAKMVAEGSKKQKKTKKTAPKKQKPTKKKQKPKVDVTPAPIDHKEGDNVRLIVKRLISAAKYTKKEISAGMLKEFPELKKTYINTLLYRACSEKHKAYKDVALIDENGILHF